MGGPVKPGFGWLFFVVFCPPVYFFLRRRVVAGVIHSFLYLMAIPLLIFFALGVFFWAIGFFHALWDFGSIKREETIQRQAEVIADKMAARVNIDRAR